MLLAAFRCLRVKCTSIASHLYHSLLTVRWKSECLEAKAKIAFLSAPYEYPFAHHRRFDADDELLRLLQDPLVVCSMPMSGV